MADVASVEVLLSTDVLTDEAQDLLLDEINGLKADLAALPGLTGGVDVVADSADAGRQGGELLRFGLELIPIALESLLMLVRERRERHRSSDRDAAAPSRLKIRVDMTSPGGRAQFELDAQGDATMPAVSALLAQLTGTSATEVE